MWQSTATYYKHNEKGQIMILEMKANEFATQAVFMSLVSTSREDLRPRLNTDNEPKLAPNGAPTYSTPLKVLNLNDGTPSAEVRGATVNLCTPIDLSFAGTYKPEGKVWITHYVTSAKQLGVSITVEKIVPVRQGLPPMPEVK